MSKSKRDVRLPEPGDEITIRVRVTRVGRNGFDTGDCITIRVPGHEVPVTVDAGVLLAARE